MCALLDDSAPLVLVVSMFSLLYLCLIWTCQPEDIHSQILNDEIIIIYLFIGCPFALRPLFSFSSAGQIDQTSFRLIVYVSI